MQDNARQLGEKKKKKIEKPTQRPRSSDEGIYPAPKAFRQDAALLLSMDTKFLDRIEHSYLIVLSSVFKVSLLFNSYKGALAAFTILVCVLESAERDLTPSLVPAPSQSFQRQIRDSLWITSAEN